MNPIKVLSIQKIPCHKVNFLQTCFFFLRHDICSIPFLLSMLFVFLALFYSKEIPSPSASAVDLFIFPISWNNAMSLVSLAAGICSAANFIQERITRYSYYILIRVSRRRYLIARFLSICVSTGGVLLIAFFLFALFCFFEANGVALPARQSMLNTQVMNSFLTTTPSLWFTAILVIQFMFGVVLGSIGICATVYIPNRFIGYSAPFIIVLIWMQVCSWLSLPSWTNPLALSKCLFHTDNAAVTLVLYICSYLIMLLLVFPLFYFTANRKMKNDR